MLKRNLWRLTFGKVPEIEPQELLARLQAEQPLQIVDIRSRHEYNRGTIGAAKHATFETIPESLTRLGLRKDLPVILICLRGLRSRPGVRWLRAQGYEAYTLKGGIMAWLMAGNYLTSPNAPQ